jgi:esterase
MTLEPAATVTRRRVRIGEIELSVAEYGDGPPLILLHGIGSRGVSWWPVIDPLAAQFRLIVPDQRGHGASDKPPVGYLHTDYAADLAGLIEALAIERPRIVGHSLGGLVTLAWAIRNPDRAERIVLEDVPLRNGPSSGAAFDGWIELASMTVDEAAARYRREHPTWSDADCRRRAESITSTSPAVFTELRDHLRHAQGIDQVALLAGIRSPVLLVYGDLGAGGMVVPSDAERFAATLPNGRLAHISGGGHSLHRDRTDEFLAAVVPFLAGQR